MPEINTPKAPGMFYRKMGSGPALVLLHGFPESGSLWRNIWDELSEKFTLIIPDFPGSGESDLTGETSIGDMAGFVNAIMEQEQIEKAVIAGHSMGGYVAFEFAANYPQKVAGLSLVHSTAAKDDEEKKKIRTKSIELIRKGGKTVFISQMVPNLFSEKFKDYNWDTVAEQIELAMEMDEDAMINFYTAMLGRRDHTSMLPNVQFPLQWIAGRKDSVISYKKILEQCHLSAINFSYIYDNCGHMSMLEVPVELVRDIASFTTYCFNNSRA